MLNIKTSLYSPQPLCSETSLHYKREVSHCTYRENKTNLSTINTMTRYNKWIFSMRLTCFELWLQIKPYKRLLFLALYNILPYGRSLNLGQICYQIWQVLTFVHIQLKQKHSKQHEIPHLPTFTWTASATLPSGKSHTCYLPTIWSGSPFLRDKPLFHIWTPSTPGRTPTGDLRITIQSNHYNLRWTTWHLNISTTFLKTTSCSGWC